MQSIMSSDDDLADLPDIDDVQPHRPSTAPNSFPTSSSLQSSVNSFRPQSAISNLRNSIPPKPQFSQSSLEAVEKAKKAAEAVRLRLAAQTQALSSTSSPFLSTPTPGSSTFSQPTSFSQNNIPKTQSFLPSNPPISSLPSSTLSSKVPPSNTISNVSIESDIPEEIHNTTDDSSNDRAAHSPAPPLISHSYTQDFESEEDSSMFISGNNQEESRKKEEKKKMDEKEVSKIRNQSKVDYSRAQSSTINRSSPSKLTVQSKSPTFDYSSSGHIKERIIHCEKGIQSDLIEAQKESQKVKEVQTVEVDTQPFSLPQPPSSVPSCCFHSSNSLLSFVFSDFPLSTLICF
ncbi:hypothetical protein RCL1_000941 [Eukaryota sp. TZLM3-RCL]